MQIIWFRFIQEIVSNRYDFVLDALFHLEPMKRFECRSKCLGVRVMAQTSAFESDGGV